MRRHPKGSQSELRKSWKAGYEKDEPTRSPVAGSRFIVPLCEIDISLFGSAF